jgi:hypothetical protein
MDAKTSRAQAVSLDLLAKSAGSDNGGYTSTAESDAASGSDALERDRLRVGPAILARFLAKINKNGPIPAHCPELGRCWLWTANQVKGYGQFVLPRDTDGKQPHFYAHRFAYELVHGKFRSPDVKACHRCDTPLCCRPSHVFPGTQGENLDDARQKGRLCDGVGARKLDDAAYQDILTAPRAYGVGVALAKKYGVTETTICRIRGGVQGRATFGKKPAPVLVPVASVQVPIRGELFVGWRQ